MRNGKVRIAIDGEICPELNKGLMTAMGWLCQWVAQDAGVELVPVSATFDISITTCISGYTSSMERHLRLSRPKRP